MVLVTSRSRKSRSWLTSSSVPSYSDSTSCSRSKRIHVEIVGRLVQHDQVAGLGEQLGQHQPRALAAGQHAHRHGGLPLVEQEVAQIGDDMARPAVDDDGIAAGRRQRLPQRALKVKALPALVEIDRRDADAEANLAAVGRDLPRQQLDQRGLARAVGAENADPVAAHDAGRESVDDGERRAVRLRVALGDVDGLDREAAAGLGVRQRQLGAAAALQAVGFLLAQREQPPPPAFVARAAGGHAALQPIFLGLKPLLQAAVFGRLLVDDLGRPLLEPVEAAVALEQPAAVQPQQAAGQLAQEGAVVADHQDAAGESRQLLFQPLDGRQVEMVGRLVQQQQVRPGEQGARQRGAPTFAARQGR